MARAKKGQAPERDRPVAEAVLDLLAWLERAGTREVRDGMARYAIPSEGAFGIPVGVLRDRAKALGNDHDLAADDDELHLVSDQYPENLVKPKLGRHSERGCG